MKAGGAPNNPPQKKASSAGATEGSFCFECERKRQNQLQSQYAIASAVQNSQQNRPKAPPPPPLLPISVPAVGHNNFAAACYNFVGPDGQYGSYGRQIEAMIWGPYYRDLVESNVLADICPRIPSMHRLDRIRVAVWLMMSLAMQEGSCNPATPHPVRDPKTGRILNRVPGIGMYAAEVSPQLREPRGEACRGDITRPEKQITCGFQSLMETVHQSGRIKHYSGSYYGSLVRWNGEVSRYFNQFQGCN